MIPIMKTAIITACLFGTVGLAASQSQQSAPVFPISSQTTSARVISDDEAKQIAVTDAGLTVQDVAFRRVYERYHGSHNTIEVEFTHRGKEYKYELDLTTGTILHSSVDSIYE